MKFITKATLVFICLTAITIFDMRVEASQLKRKNRIKSCQFFFFKDGPVEDIDGSGFVFPGDAQNSGKALENAKLQTKAARKFFSFEYFNNIASIILKNVAKNFYEFLKSNEDILDKIANPDHKVTRQAQSSGTWGHWDSIFKEVIKDYYKLEKSLPPNEDCPQANEVKNKRSNNKIQEFKAFIAKKFTRSVVYEIANFKTGSSPRNMLGFLGLIGDVGAVVQDSIGRGEHDKMTKDQQNLVEAIKIFFGENITNASKNRYASFSPDKYYNVPGGRGKKQERPNCSSNKTKDEMKLERAGVLNVGAVVDRELGVSEYTQLPNIAWPWQTVPKSFVEHCPNEPWAGHFSGSLYELIFMLELFDRNSENIKQELTPELDKKKAYAAIASSFLVATGMHSAVELVYVVKNYLGVENVPTDIFEVCDGASNYIVNLIEEVAPQTNEEVAPQSNDPRNPAHVTNKKKLRKKI